MNELYIYALALAFPFGFLVGWIAYKIESHLEKRHSKIDVFKSDMDLAVNELQESSERLRKQVEEMKVYNTDFKALDTLLDDLDIPIQD